MGDQNTSTSNESKNVEMSLITEHRLSIMLAIILKWCIILMIVISEWTVSITRRIPDNWWRPERESIIRATE